MGNLRKVRARGIATVLVGVVFAATVGAPVAGAAATSRGPGPARPAPVVEPEQCTQRAAHRTHDEWLQCVGVAVTLRSVPAVGDTAVVDVTVTADVDRPTLGLRLDVPAAIQIVAAGGAKVGAAAAADGSGAVRRASVASPLAAGAKHTYTFRVRPTATGIMHIVATATARVSASRTDAGSDDIFLTVGTTAAASHLGATTNAAKVGRAVAIAAGSAVAVNTARGKHDAARPIAHHPSADDGATPAAPPGQSCAVGGYYYVDNKGATRSATNQTVEAWDQDTLSSDDLLATAVVGFDGRFRLCFNNDDGETGPTQEVYLKFISANSVWRVRDTAASNNNYVVQSGVVGICDTCETDFGGMQTSDNTWMRGMHAFDELNDLWVFVHGANGCFDRNDATCRQMVLDWTPTSTDGTVYQPTTDDIHLSADDPNAPITVVHEGSHALMDDVYEDVFPAHPNCIPHNIDAGTSAGCAWVEGFAEWLPAEVYNDPFFRWPDGRSFDLENSTWNTGSVYGDTVEGRVASAMIDISDSTNEKWWDLGGEGFGPQFDTFINQNSSTFSEFLLTDRPAQGYATNDNNALAAAFQSTIDYGFRDPLFTRVTKHRPPPYTIQNFGYNTSSAYWSVVALRPGTFSDDDIYVYDDHGLATLIGSSSLGRGIVDFVAVDTNRRAAGDYYPRTTNFGGDNGEYDIEFVEGNTTVPNGTHTVSFGAGDVIQTEDTSMTAGVPTYFRVVPAAGQDLSLHLLRSDASNTASFVQGRSSAVATSDVGGAGIDEAVSYTDTANQWDAIVVVNRSGSGTYTMYRDTTAPAGEMVIGAGDPVLTTTRTVHLQMAAEDADTGIKDMRIAADGVLDSEPWVPYSETSTITIPGADGLKTVAVQFRNNALMTTVASDTITLDTRPNYKVTKVSNPPATGERGTTFNLTDTTKNFSGATSTTSITNYYLSKNATKDAGDALLGGRAITGLGANKASNGGLANALISDTTPSGSYFVLACADDSNLLAETSELDNCKKSATKITVRVPEYTVTKVSNPATPSTQGASLSITDSVKNSGDPAASTSMNVYYLSLDKIVGGSDYTLSTTRGVPALAAGATNTGTKSITIPFTTPPGRYFVIVCADAGNTVAEANETNNCRSSGKTVKVQAFTAGATFRRSGSWSVR